MAFAFGADYTRVHALCAWGIGVHSARLPVPAPHFSKLVREPRRRVQSTKLRVGPRSTSSAP